MDIKKLIYKSPALSGEYPDFNTEAAPADPFETFYEWFEQAVEAEVMEPGAFVYSTADGEGAPSARIVNLRDMPSGHFIIGSNSESRKGKDIEENADAAMTFYWREVGRQVRITGRVDVASEEENRADFLRRNPTSKALSLIAKQSSELSSMKELDRNMQEALNLVAADPTAYRTWTLYKVRPSEMEFFQARKNLAHIRLRYERTDEGWKKALLWP